MPWLCALSITIWWQKRACRCPYTPCPCDSDLLDSRLTLLSKPSNHFQTLAVWTELLSLSFLLTRITAAPCPCPPPTAVNHSGLDSLTCTLKSCSLFGFSLRGDAKSHLTSLTFLLQMSWGRFRWLTVNIYRRTDSLLQISSRSRLRVMFKIYSQHLIRSFIWLFKKCQRAARLICIFLDFPQHFWYSFLSKLQWITSRNK